MSYRIVAWQYMADRHCESCADEAGMTQDGTPFSLHSTRKDI